MYVCVHGYIRVLPMCVLFTKYWLTYLLTYWHTSRRICALRSSNGAMLVLRHAPNHLCWFKYCYAVILTYIHGIFCMYGFRRAADYLLLFKYCYAMIFTYIHDIFCMYGVRRAADYHLGDKRELDFLVRARCALFINLYPLGTSKWWPIRRRGRDRGRSRPQTCHTFQV